MRIERVTARQVELPLAGGYRITGHSVSATTQVLFRIDTDLGLCGYGAAAPAVEVTGETHAMSLAALEGALAESLVGSRVPEDPATAQSSLLRAAQDCPAARAAADIALWDLAAKRLDKPLYEVWGGRQRGLPTSVTLGIDDAAGSLEEARDWLARGFRILKVKVGEDIDADIERIGVLRDTLGPEVVIRVDANQGYDFGEARRLLDVAGQLGIELLEEPMRRGELGAMAALTRGSPIPLVADESATSVDDCRRVIDAQAASGINIKFMKCGGPSAARVIYQYAQDAGIGLMLGCNDETRISIAAALHFASAMPGITWCDLDGHMDLARDPVEGGFTVRDGRLWPGQSAGLGVSIGDF